MLRTNEKTNDCGRMGVGLVDGHRRAASLPGGDDLESLLRDGGDGPRCPVDGYRSGSVQNYEGTFGDLAKPLQPIQSFFSILYPNIYFLNEI